MLKTSTIGPFTIGINNRARDYALPAGAVRDAVNVDLSLDGRARQRAGVTIVHDGDAVSSLWSNGSRAFYKDSSTLFELFDDLRGAISRDTGLSTTHELAYVDVPGRGIAYSDGSVIRRLVDSAVKPFGLERPRAAPTLTGGVGSLPSGYYQAACSYRDALGEESGLSPTSVLQLGGSGLLNVSLPQPSDSGISEILVYMTPPNGDQLYLATIVDVGTMSQSFPVLPALSISPATRFLRTLPPGDILAFYHGRTISHMNGLLSFTQPYSSQYLPSRDYIPLPAPVSIIHPTAAGLWIVADKTYFIDELDEKSQLKVVNPIDAVFGTLARLPDSEEATWFTPQGLAITDGGGLTLLQQDNVMPSSAQRGASVYREQDGLKQAITSLRNPSRQVGGASAWYSATLVSGETRNGFE